MRSKTTFCLLAFFMGAFGVHHFYVGRLLWGGLSLLFFWTLLPGVAALIEFCIVASMNDDDFNLKFNRGLVSASVDSLEKLARLHQLRLSGVLSEDEYQSEKKKVMVS